MLSICIPIFNFDMRKLVYDLSNQMAQAKYPCQLILIDDKSSDTFRGMNREVCSKHLYIELKENIGRSRIRNLFLNYAEFENLLFLDCDVQADKQFLENYLNFIENNSFDVVFGGLKDDLRKPPASHRLRWQYANKRENADVEIRSAQPYKFFKTCNFIIRKETLNEIKFDEKIIGYGHEDTLFAIELEKRGKTVLHTDNAVYHISNESNKLFLDKTEEAVKNLVYIYNTNENKKEIAQYSKLLSTHFKLRKYRLLTTFNLFYGSVSPLVYRRLLSGSGCMMLLDLFKLNTLNKEMKKHRKSHYR